MMTRSHRFPASSFGAELQATLREGANKELRLKFDSEAIATRFMHRINALRAAMKREAHSEWEQLYRCGVHRDPSDRKIIILSPRDSEFRTALQDAGVTLTAPIPPISEYTIKTPKALAPSIDPDPAEDFLATLRDATTIPPKK
jgi:hypothetical protein